MPSFSLQGSKESLSALPLTLTTLAGEDIHIAIDPHEHDKGQLKGEAKAIRVPFGRNDKIPPQAFSFHTEVRHVLVEAGIRIVGEPAWRSCQRLQVVHLPDTVVSLRHGAFRRCCVLRAVTAPGCKQFGIKVFEACCSLTQIGTTQHPDNLLAPQAQFRPRAFEKCTALRHLNMDKAEHDPHTRTDACLNVVSWKQELSHFPCRQTLIG